MYEVVDFSPFLIGWIKTGFVIAFTLHMTCYPSGLFAQMIRNAVLRSS